MSHGPLRRGYDKPSGVAEQLRWLISAVPPLM